MSIRTMAAVVAMAVAACGGTDSDSGSTAAPGGSGGSAGSAAAGAGGGGAAGASASAAKLTGKLVIPANLVGEPVRVVLAAASALPLAGPPDGGVLFEDKAPVITAGGEYQVNADVSMLIGKYQVLAILYMKGGGNFSPKAGIDYDAATTMALTFDGKTALDLGKLPLALHMTGDGH